MNVQTTVGIVSTLSGAAAVWYGIRRARQVDSNTARSGDIAQIISALQEDGRAYRQENKDLKAELKAMAQECKDEIAAVNKRLNSFIRKYGVENGDNGVK